MIAVDHKRTQKHRKREAKRHPEILRTTLRRTTEPTQSYSQRIGRAQKRYGTDLEHRAIEAFSSGTLPEWVLGVRPATEVEDQSGVDLWVLTAMGDIAVQIKSSAMRADEFVRSHPLGTIAVVVLHWSMSDEVIRDRILDRAARVKRAA